MLTGPASIVQTEKMASCQFGQHKEKKTEHEKKEIKRGYLIWWNSKKEKAYFSSINEEQAILAFLVQIHIGACPTS